MQCGIVNFLGSVFMKKLPMKEVEEAIHIIDGNKYNIHTEQDLADFLASTSNEPLPLHTPQYRMWLVDNYTEAESALMFKEHHVMADGVGVLEIILLLTDEFRPDVLNNFRPTTWFKKLFLYTISPFFIFYYLIPTMFKRADKFSITNTKLTGERNFAAGKSFNLQDLKKTAKALKVSINDLTSAALSAGLTEYLQEKGDLTKGPLTATIPVNLRTKKIHRPSDIKLENNFTLLLLDLMIGDPLEKEIKRINKLMSKAKKSCKPLATMYIQKLSIFLMPLFITRPLIDFGANKCTLGFSNVPGFRTPLKIKGCQANNLLFFIPGMSSIGLGISMFSYVDHFKIGVASDKS